MLLQNIHNKVCSTIRCPKSMHFMKIHYLELLKSRTMNIKNWKVDGNVRLGKLNYRRTVLFHLVFNITYFFHQLCTLLYIVSQETEETTPFSTQNIFYYQDHICWISNFYNKYALGRYSHWLLAGRFGIESRWRRDVLPVQTGPCVHPASCKMGTGPFRG